MAKTKIDLSKFIVNEDEPKLSSKQKIDLNQFIVKEDTIEKKNPTQNATASLGQTSSTVGSSDTQPAEDDSWAIAKNLKGFAKSMYNYGVKIIEGGLRYNAASGSMGSGAPSQYLAQDIKGTNRKQEDTYKQRIEGFDKDILPALESIKFQTKGSSDIFTEKGLRIPDAEAVGYQMGEGLIQLGLNFLGPAGVAMNFFANSESNYQDARKRGIPADRALVESTALSGMETAMDRALGVERLLGKKAIGKAAVSQIAKERLTKEAFDESIKQSVSMLSKEALKKTAKGAGFEAIDEGIQNFSSEGVKQLFDIYQTAKAKDDPNAKIELYGADAFSKKTLVGSLNSGFYGGLTAGIGSSFTSSKSFTPTVYSSMQNAYDAGGVQELANSKAIVEKGINQALQEKKMTPQEHQVALTNLNNIASDVQSYSQNSKADSYTRFQKFDIENNQIPNASARVAESFVEQLAPTVQANESDIENDIEQGNTTELQFDSRENVPDEFIPYLTDEKVVINGQEVVSAQVPASIAQAFEQNKQNKQNAIQVVSQAISESTKSSGGVSFEGLLSRIQAAFGDTKSKEAIALEATSKKKDITKDLRLINYLTESKNEITKNGSLDVEKSQQGYENWLKANEGTEVEYQGNKHTIEDVSHNAQQVKLSGVDGFVNTSDVTIAKEDNTPSAMQVAEDASQEVAPQEGIAPISEKRNEAYETKKAEIEKAREDALDAMWKDFSNEKIKGLDEREAKRAEIQNKYEQDLEALDKLIPTQPQQTDGQTTEQGQETANISDAIPQVVSAETPKTKSRTKIVKPKGRVHERALESEDNSAIALAIKYFAGGGKVLRDTPANNTSFKPKSLAGLFKKRGRTSKGEMASRRSISATKEQGGLSLDMIAHKLWENNTKINPNLTTEDYLNAIEEVLLNNNTKTEMAQSLLNLNNVGSGVRVEGVSEQESAWIEFEASQMGMSVDEFLDYLDNNPNARNAADLTLEEIENALQDEALYNELVNGLDLTPQERADLDEVFAESTSKEQSVEPPIVPPAPPSDTNEEDTADDPENEPTSEEDDLSLTILSREEASKLAQEAKKKAKVTWNKIVEALAESDVSIRKALERASGKDSFVVALLRNRRGLTAAITQDLQKLDEKIFKGLEEVGLDRFNTLVYAYNTIQKDERRDKQRNREVENLIEQYKEKNEGKFPDAQTLEDIKEKAQKTFPQLSHGTVKIPINGKLKEVPMTSEIAKDKIAKIEKALGDKFPKMKERIDNFKKVGNDMLKREYDNGMISKEVYEDMKDDFYAMRMTIERAFEQINSSDKIAYRPVLDSAFGSLSKDGTTKAIITDSRLLMQVAYSKMEQAIKRNELKVEIYKATVAQGKEQDLFKEAEVQTYTDENGDEVARQDIKGDVLIKNVPKGFQVVGYKENGRAKYFLMNEDLYNQLYNLNALFSDKSIDIAVIRELVNARNFGNRALTGFATRYNPLFFISNASMDMAQQIIFSDIWDGGKTYSNLASTTLKALARSAKFIDITGRNKKDIQAIKERAIELGLGMDLMSLTSETKKQFIEEGAVTPILDVDNDGKIKRAAKWLSQLNPRVEWAMRLAAFDEVQSRLTKDFEAKNNRKPNEREQYEIDTIAVSKARAYTDFAEKGTVTPALNVPYLTSSIAAFSSAIKYTANNPKAFAFKAAQMATAGFAYQLASLVAMGLIGEPEDYLNIKEYDKNKNILIPFRYKTVKDKFGNDKIEFAFAPIRVNPSNSPIWVASRMAAEETYAKIMGIETKKTSGLDKVDTFIDIINEALPVALPVAMSLDKFKKRVGAILSRDLFFSAGIKGFTGYDPYRGDEMLTYDDKRGESGAEGLKNKNIPFAYKKLGEITGLSPVRTKAVVETFTTSGHQAVQLAYAISSEIASALSKKESATVRGESGFTDIPMMKKLAKDLAGRRLLITSDVNYAYNKETEENYKKAESISRKYLTQEFKLRIELEDLRKSSKSEIDFLNKVKTQVLPEYQKQEDIVKQIDVMQTAKQIITKSIKRDMLTPEEYDDAAVIKITQTPKGKADMLYYMYEGDKKQVMSTLGKSGALGVPKSELGLTLLEYEKLIKEKK